MTKKTQAVELIDFDLDRIPDELKRRAQWVGFKITPALGKAKPKKTPVIADAPNHCASVTDSRTWRTFDKAAAGLRRKQCHAIAYALNGDFIFIDLDDCWEGDNLAADAEKIVTDCDSYTEESVTGKGVHVLLKGKLPPHAPKRSNGIEVYGAKRFCIMTGAVLQDTPDRIRKNREAVDRALQRVRKRSVIEQAEQPEQAEQIGNTLCNAPARNVSVTSCTPAEVIECTLPAVKGERNARVMELARGLKLNCKLPRVRDCKPHVRDWHKRALPIIATKDFDETWADFAYAWERAYLPLGADADAVLQLAWERAQREQEPDAAGEYDNPKVKQLVCLCNALAAHSSEGRFYFAMHRVASLLGVDSMTVSRWVNMLAADGVIKITRKGNERQCNRYRWIADGGDEP